MAVETGFAESHTDLLEKLYTFLTATMTPSADRWISQRHVTTTGSEEVILKGVGSGTDQIYVGIKAFSDSGTDNYGWILNGFTGFNTSLSFYDQPGAMQVGETLVATPLLKSIPADANAIKYWFVANARRFMVIARTGTVYHQTYLGWFLPYGTPLQYPYPLIVGGSGLVNALGVPKKQSDTDSQIQSFWRPINGVNVGANFPNAVGSLALRDPAGAWKRPIIDVTGTNNSGCNGTWPYVEGVRNTASGVNNMRPNLDGTYTLQPVIIVQGSPANMWGEFDGMRHVTGNNITAEDLVEISTDDWLVMQDVFRSGDAEAVVYKLI